MLLSLKNRKDVEEISAEYLNGMDVRYVDTVKEVVDFALLPEKVANPLDLSIDEKLAEAMQKAG